MISIRPAQSKDAPFIADIYRPFVEYGWASFEAYAPDSAEIVSRIKKAGNMYPWLVAEDNNTVLGYAYASAHRARDAYRTSVDTSIYCAKNARGNGVGRKLYATLLETLKRQNYVSAFAGIALPNEASIGLHHAMGFTLIGTYPKVGYKQGVWRDTQWWHRPLADTSDRPAEILSYLDIL
jgi:L-amino acid N-acyltransferase YncA